jgi:hypothetical protein
VNGGVGLFVCFVLFRFDVKSGRRLTTHLRNGCHWICIFYLETYVTMIAGSVQQREAAVQVFPSSATPEGPAVDQRSQPFGPEECPDAANGHGTRTVSYARTDTHHGKIGIARVIRRLLAFSLLFSSSFICFNPLPVSFLSCNRRTFPWLPLIWFRLAGDSKLPTRN